MSKTLLPVVFRHGFILKRTRFIEIDILRGVCVFLMVLLHIWWDLEYFKILKVDRGVYQLQHIVAPLFFVLMGMCLIITYSQYKRECKNFYYHAIFRGLYIFALGLFLSLISFVVIPDRPIYFGVLHCIGLSIIFCLPFLRLQVYSIVFAVFFICTGFVLGSLPMREAGIIHIVVGIHPQGMYRYTVDYFPLLPWLGVALLGVAIGSMLYRNGERCFSIPDLSRYRSVFPFSWLGRHSLVVYLLHQPVIVGFIQGFLYLSRAI
ncbi:MAG: heparan-alpha-glucosaminide N-acetyltransferase [Candidatus Thermoplasmatota archaeon]